MPSTTRLASALVAAAALTFACAPNERPDAPPETPVATEPRADAVVDGFREYRTGAGGTTGEQVIALRGGVEFEEADDEEEDAAFEATLRRRDSLLGRGGGGGRRFGVAARGGASDDAPDSAGSEGGGGGQEGGRRHDDDDGTPLSDDAEKGARARTWKRAQVVPNATRMSVGHSTELPLEGLQVQVRVDGFRARVVLDCLYRNTLPRQLEGRFQLRLPDGAAPHYFAFGETVQQATAPAAFLPEGVTASVGTSLAEIRSRRRVTWSAPKEARMVPRRKAAHAYAETTRRRIDPALMEWSGAGVFEARVFPLESTKLHRIVIGYDVNLVPVGDALEYRLDLPEGVPALTLDLDVADVPGATHELDGDDFVRTTAREGVTHYRTTSTDTRTVKLRIAGAANTLLTGRDPGTGEHFAATLRPDVPADEHAGRRRAVFLLDVSTSSNPERFGVWVRLLQEILARNEGSLREFAVLCFNVESFWWQEGFVPNDAARRRAVRAFADDLALEGATDLAGALAAAANPGWMDGDGAYDTFLLSDGAASWGPRDLHDLAASFAGPGTGALFAYKTGFAGTDLRVLDHLARETGGAVFSVVGDAEIASAAVAHRARPWRLRGIAVDGGSDLLLAGRPTAIFPGQTLYLAGRGTPAANASVVLTLEQGGVERAVRVPLRAGIPSDLAPRVYGQIATTQLEEFTFQTEKASRAYAQHYRVVGDTCSLLMLDSKADYERFDIRPEDDARTVRGTPAGTEVTRALDAYAELRSDPRAAFLARLDRLERTSGVTFEGLDALRKLVRDLPRSSFLLGPRRLACTQRTWDGVPGDVQELLAARRLDYVKLNEEAERRRGKHGAADGLRVLSSLVEQRPGDVALLRDVAFTAMEWDLDDQAYGLLERSADARPYEPETYRMLAECLDALGRTDLATLYYEICLAGSWSTRFGEFRRIAGMDYVRFLRRQTVLATSSPITAFKERRLAEVTQDFAPARADIVVTITWNTDRTDVDLHVTDPRGETCNYNQRRTLLGGRMTKDVTGGYGPEMFHIPEAPEGKYSVRVRYYSSDRLRAGLRTRVFATIVRHWGTPEEQVLRKAVTLTDGKEYHTLGRIVVR